MKAAFGFFLFSLFLLDGLFVGVPYAGAQCQAKTYIPDHLILPNSGPKYADMTYEEWPKYFWVRTAYCDSSAMDGVKVTLDLFGVSYCGLSQVYTAYSDADGFAVWNVGGGGCNMAGGARVTVFAKDFPDEELYSKVIPVNSPDINGDLQTTLGDVGLATTPIKNGEPDPCVNFFKPYDDGCGLGDAAFLTPYFKLGDYCH